MTARLAAEPVRGHPLARTVGVAGLVGTVLLFVALSTGTPGEPATDATTAAAAEFLRGLDGTWVQLAEVLADIAMFVVLWFMVGFALLLRRVEGDIPLRSTMAMLSGVLVAAFVILDSSEEAATHRAGDLAPGQLAYAYDVTTVGFTNIWLPMGGFAFACGWIILSSSAMPRWLGWWGLVNGIVLGLAQFFWRDVVWLVPYAGFWVWLLTCCVLLVRRPSHRAG